jgi:hypothetical protein
MVYTVNVGDTLCVTEIGPFFRVVKRSGAWVYVQNIVMVDGIEALIGRVIARKIRLTTYGEQIVLPAQSRSAWAAFMRERVMNAATGPDQPT